MDGPDVEAHYDGEGDLVARLFAALRESGRDPEGLTRDDLAPFAEFHVRGREATRDLARLGGLDGERVLDVGCGLGGPARTLAAEFDCRVVGLDRTGAFLEAARELTARAGPADRVALVRGDALSLPVSPTFDAAVLQHVAPNVPDHGRLLAELRRVLPPGGRLLVHEPLRPGDDADPRYPMPFAREPADATLATPDAFRVRAVDAGFEVREWADDTDACLAWYETLEGPPAVGLDVVIGPDFPEMGRNVRHNLETGQLQVWRGVFEV